MTTNSTDLKGQQPPKQRYERPRLEVYGNIRDVTDNLGRTSKSSDNAHGSTNKTS